MTTEYDEELGYDADHDDESQYCKHGTFIGSWWGPDYLCWACEDGLSVAEYELIQARNAVATWSARLDRQYGARNEDMVAIVRDQLGWNGTVADWLVRQVTDDWDLAEALCRQLADAEDRLRRIEARQHHPADDGHVTGLARGVFEHD